jgi:hypothetical protein
MEGFYWAAVMYVPGILLYFLFTFYLCIHLLGAYTISITYIMSIKPSRMFPLNSEMSSRNLPSFDPFILQSFLDLSPVGLATNRHTPLDSDAIDLSLAPTTPAS